LDTLVESKYKFTDYPDGFTISGPDRTPVRVICDGKNFLVKEEAYVKQAYLYNERQGLFMYTNIMQAISDILMMNWKRPEEHFKKKCSWVIHKWAKTRTIKALSKRFHARWVALLEKCDSRVVQAQRSYFAATGRYHGNLIKDALYTEKHKFVLSDICKYRAAALTVPDMYFYNSDNFYGWHNFYGRQTVEHRYATNWMEIYSYGGKTNSSLRKTLMNLPGCTPYHLLKNIALKEMDRPILSRPELIAYLSTFNYARGKQERACNVLRKSNAEQIRRAVKMVAAHLRISKPRLRKTNFIASQLSYIFDCDEPHNGAITGMAEKSIRWHRGGNYNAQRANCKYAPNTPVKQPSVPLPNSKCVKFLDTVQKIWDESTEMGHCVSGYAPAAVEGKSFLFHVDYAGDCATVEVSPEGYVSQARGPHNCSNKATNWAARYFKKWAEQFTNNTEP
jgi:hypothetical protein